MAVHNKRGKNVLHHLNFQLHVQSSHKVRRRISLFTTDRKEAFTRLLEFYVLLQFYTRKYFSKEKSSFHFQAKFEKTATLMRHHHRPHDLNRHSLSVLLDPSRPPTSVDSISGTSMDQTMIGMSEPITFDDDPIFVPHYEKVSIILRITCIQMPNIPQRIFQNNECCKAHSNRR